MKRVHIFATCGLTIVVGALLYTIHGRDRVRPVTVNDAGANAAATAEKVQVRATPRASATTRASAKPSLARRMNAQAEIQRIIRQDVDVASGGEAGLERYLDTLVARAEARGRVTALEVQPGLAAMRRPTNHLEPVRALQLQLAFSRRMRTLSRRLEAQRGADNKGAPAPPDHDRGDQPTAGTAADLHRAIETKRSRRVQQQEEGQAPLPGQVHARVVQMHR